MNKFSEYFVRPAINVQMTVNCHMVRHTFQQKSVC